MAAQPKHELDNSDLSALEELLTESGYTVESKTYGFGGRNLKVTTKDGPVDITIGYNCFMATGKIPGFSMRILGHGPYTHELVI